MKKNEKLREEKVLETLVRYMQSNVCKLYLHINITSGKPLEPRKEQWYIFKRIGELTFS